MSPQVVIDLLEAKPFRPFVVYLTYSEAEIYVEVPEQARVEGDTLYFKERAGRAAAKWDTIADLKLAVAIKVRRGKSDESD